MATFSANYTKNIASRMLNSGERRAGISPYRSLAWRTRKNARAKKELIRFYGYDIFAFSKGAKKMNWFTKLLRTIAKKLGF